MVYTQLPLRIQIILSYSGGVFVMAMGERYLHMTPELTTLEQEMKDLETAGKWKRITRRILPIPEYAVTYDGVLFVFKILWTVLSSCKSITTLLHVHSVLCFICNFVWKTISATSHRHCCMQTLTIAMLSHSTLILNPCSTVIMLK